MTSKPLTAEELAILEAISKQFMVPEFSVGQWWQVDGPAGIESYPAEHFTKAQAIAHYKGQIHANHYEVSSRYGAGVRLSAPGYMDATEWTVFDTIEDAQRYIVDTYGDDIELED